MSKPTGNIAEVIAPMMAIAMELDVIISTLLREKFSMSLADFKILRAIFMLGGACSQLEVARCNYVTEAAISKRIKALIDVGLIEKRFDDKDKRKAILSLTKPGKVLMAKLQTTVISNTELVLADFSKTKRKVTAGLLREILGLIVEHSPRKETLMGAKHPIIGQFKPGAVSGN